MDEKTASALLYDALVAAGTDPERAMAASHVISGFVQEFNQIQTDLLTLKWIVGITGAGIIALVVDRLF